MSSSVGLTLPNVNGAGWLKTLVSNQRSSRSSAGPVSRPLVAVVVRARHRVEDARRVAGRQRQRRAALKGQDAVHLPAPRQRVDDRRQIPAEPPAAPNRQLVQEAHDEAMRHVERRHRAAGADVVAVLVRHPLVQGLRPGVRTGELQPAGHPLRQARLQRVVERRRAGGIERDDVGELRIGAQQLRPADARAGQHAVGHDAVERIVHQLIQRRAERQVLRIELVEAEAPFAVGVQVVPLRADIGELEGALPGQLPLDRDVPLAVPRSWRPLAQRRLQVGADLRQQPFAGTRRRPETLRIWIAQQVERRDAVERRHPRVLGAEAEGTDGSLRRLVRGSIDVAVAGTHHRGRRSAGRRRRTAARGCWCRPCTASGRGRPPPRTPVRRAGPESPGPRRPAGIERWGRSSSSGCSARSAACRSRSAARGSA